MFDRGGAASVTVGCLVSALVIGSACATGIADGPESEGGSPAVTVGSGGAGGAPSVGGSGGAGGEGGSAPVCGEVPCKLTLPQCGCDAGEACQFAGGARSCAPEGDKALSEACADDCVAGHQCLGNSQFDTPPICTKWCETDDDCSGPGALCLFTITGETSKLCSINCDPVSNAGCLAEGTKCEVLRENAGAMRWLTYCAGIGAGEQASPCTETQECAEGHGCFNVTDANMMTSQMCLRWCDTQSPTSCPAGSQCGSFTMPIVIGSITYGACVPTG